MARIDTKIWDDPEWRAINARGQLLAITCMALGATGNCSDSRIMRRTGFTAEFLSEARAEVARSAYAHVLEGTKKRRRMSPALSRAVFDRDRRTCQHCGSSARLTVDHIIPVSKGGADDMDNLQTLCLSCNARKGARVG